MKRLACLLAIAGCQPTGQILLHVDTDAPVPPAIAAAADPTRPPWLFDRLRIELRRSDGTPAAAGAARDFDVNEGTFRDGLASVGIAPQPGDDGLVARVRLFRGDRLRAGQPHAHGTIEALVSLPAIAADELRHVTVRLRVDQVGLSAVLAAPEEGEPGPSEVGGWPGAQIVPCATAAGDGEVCVPGGAYWMGDPDLAVEDGSGADDEKLVVVSPLFLDVRHVLVSEMRAQRSHLSAVPFPWKADCYDNFACWCTFTSGASAADPADSHAQLPANCIDWALADEYCTELGKRLPTEAELEFVASGRGQERPFVWGEDEPSCSDAVWARGGVGYYSAYARDCYPAGTNGGLLPPGSGQRDRIAFGDPVNGRVAEVVDLAGNVGNWARDRYSQQDEAFWNHGGVFRDPVADRVSAAQGAEHTIKGGKWIDAAVQLRAGYRVGLGDPFGNTATGFRCSRPGR